MYDNEKNQQSSQAHWVIWLSSRKQSAWASQKLNIYTLWHFCYVYNILFEMKASRGKAGPSRIASRVTLYSHSVCKLWRGDIRKQREKDIHLGRGLGSCISIMCTLLEHSRGSEQVSQSYTPMKNELLIPDQETKGTWALVLWESSTLTERSTWIWLDSSPFTLRHGAQFTFLVVVLPLHSLAPCAGRVEKRQQKKTCKKRDKRVL